jgi:hypothetical protein
VYSSDTATYIGGKFGWALDVGGWEEEEGGWRIEDGGWKTIDERRHSR